TTSYQQFTIPFETTATDINARLSFDGVGMATGDVWFAQVSLKPGGTYGLVAGENLDTKTMLYQPSTHCTVSPVAATDRTRKARRDWTQFLWETERTYWQTMYSYIKTTLGYKGLVTSTAAWFGTPNLMADMDFVDTHGYWQHPTFPGIPWDPIDWYQWNNAMVNNPPGAAPPTAGWRTY